MPLFIPQESAEAIERAKWEMWPNKYGPPGRPFVYQEFPKALYMGSHDSTGKRTLIHVIVANEREETEQRDRGYHPRQEDALEAAEKSDLQIAVAAAELNARVKRMGEQARREAAATIDTAGEHIGEVPETPVRKKPGRPRKQTAQTVEG